MKQLIHRLWFLLMGALLFIGHGYAYGQTPSETKQVLYYLAPPNERLVVINWGSDAGLRAGTLLKSLRPQKNHTGESSLMVETGQLKVQQVSKDYSIAEIIAQGSATAELAFAEHPRVMAGDRLELPRYLVSRRQQILPEALVPYNDIFKDPKSSPFTFELSAAGKKKLLAVGETYKDKKFSLLLVKGFTDPSGPSDINQVESYQRALTVRQFLIEQLGFAPERIVALGLGELDPIDDSNVAGSSERNRRISLEVVANAFVDKKRHSH